MLTAWGYEVEGSALPPLLGLDDFDCMTGGGHAGDLRAMTALTAASHAVRQECGWHVSPSLECSYTVPRAGEEGAPARLVALPALAVSDVVSVMELGAELAPGEYEWARDGLVSRCCFKAWPTAWNAVSVRYVAGLDAAAAPDLVEAVVAIAEGVLAVAAGVSSESADGVTVSYARGASSVAAALAEQMAGSLSAYRLVRSHAA